MSGTWDGQISPEDQEAIQRQKKLETWSAHRVNQWPRKLQIDDYNFRSWGKGANKNLLGSVEKVLVLFVVMYK